MNMKYISMMIAGFGLVAVPVIFHADEGDTGDGYKSKQNYRTVGQHRLLRLDVKGDRINNRLDRKGERIDRRLDRKGERIDRQRRLQKGAERWQSMTPEQRQRRGMRQRPPHRDR